MEIWKRSTDPAYNCDHLDEALTPSPKSEKGSTCNGNGGSLTGRATPALPSPMLNKGSPMVASSNEIGFKDAPQMHVEVPRRDSVLDKTQPTPLSKHRSRPSARNFSRTLNQVPEGDGPLLATHRLKAVSNLFISRMELFSGLDEQVLASRDADHFVSQTLDTAALLLALTKYVRVYASINFDVLDKKIQAFEGHLDAVSVMAYSIKDRYTKPGSLRSEKSSLKSVEVTAANCIQAAAESVAEANCSLAEDGDFVLDLDFLARVKNAWKAATPTSPSRNISDRSKCTGLETPEHIDAKRSRLRDQGVQRQTPHSNDGKPAGIMAKVETDQFNCASASDFSSRRNSTCSSRSASTRATTPDVSHRTQGSDCESMQVDVNGVSWDFPAPSEPAFNRELVLANNGRVLGGTPHALLLDLIYNQETVNSTRARAFLLFFRAFLLPGDLAGVLIDHCRSQDTSTDNGIANQIHIVNLIREWRSRYWDNDKDAAALKMLQDFYCSDYMYLSLTAQHILFECFTKTSLTLSTTTVPCIGLTYLTSVTDEDSPLRRHSVPLELCQTSADASSAPPTASVKS